MSLLGIDIGSSSCKGVVFDVNGKELAKEIIAYNTFSRSPAMVELPAETFRDAVFNIIRLLNEKLKEDPVQAIAISSHGETIIGVDENGNATMPAIMNADNRATKEATWFVESFGEEKLYEITGVPPHPMFSICKILWIKNNTPEIYAVTDKFLSVGDYILKQLGLPAYTDYSLAGRTMAFDISSLSWSDDILKHCGIEITKLATPVSAGTIAGKLSKTTADDLNLNEGVIIAVGGHDQPCGALGSGAIGNGRINNSAGTYECMTAVSNKPLNNKKSFGYKLNSYCHVVPGHFVTLAFFPGGLVSNWFINQFLGEEKWIAQHTGKDFYSLIAENVEVQCPGSTGIFITPHFAGSGTPSWNVKAKGIAAGLNPSATKFHIYKAIFEGIACELDLNAKVLDEALGSFDAMTISGGNCRADFSIRLRADITGKKMLLLENDEAVCLGAAMLAGIAAGFYKDAEDAVKKAVRIRKTIAPDKTNQETYKGYKEKYQSLYPMTKNFW